MVVYSPTRSAGRVVTRNQGLYAGYRLSSGSPGILLSGRSVARFLAARSSGGVLATRPVRRRFRNDSSLALSSLACAVSRCPIVGTARIRSSPRSPALAFSLLLTRNDLPYQIITAR